MPSPRDHAVQIWRAAVTAADPFECVVAFLANDPILRDILADSGRVLVCGGGKAGPAMAAGVESALAGVLDRVFGLVNVPAGSERALKRIQLRAARPAASNHPTAEGVAGVEEQLAMLAELSANDVGLCLLSGGGSCSCPLRSQEYPWRTNRR